MSEERIIAEIITLIKYKNKEYEVRDLINYLCNEIEKRDNIIKEVREYIMSELISEWDIKNDGYVSGSDLPVDAITPILEILDKENN